MEETMNQNVEMAGEDELFFDVADLPEADGGDHTPKAAEGPNAAEGGEASNRQEDPDPPEGAPEGQEKLADEAQWEEELNFLGQTKKVSREEGIKLMQMGLNHDRMREQRDAMRNALQEQMNWRSQNESHMQAIEELAKATNMDVPAFIASMQESMYVRNGMSRDAARERIEREKVQRQLDAKNQVDQQRAAQENAHKTRVQRETEEFAKAFPEVDVKSIPKEVFQQASAGGVSLTGAYISHLNSQLKAENERLQAEVNAYKKNEENKKIAVGSAKTQGGDAAHDSFLQGFNS